MKLHISDVATSLNLPENTLTRWIRQGRVPINRSGDICIFKKEKLEEWAKRNNLVFNSESEDTKSARDKSKKTLSSSIDSGHVLHELTADSKEDLFSKVVETLELEDSIKKDLLKRLRERENMSSTGVGKGVAIPHPRNPVTTSWKSPKIVTVFLKEAIDFDSIDNEKVFVLFFILCRDVKEHLKVLSNLSFCLRHESFVEFLGGIPSKEELLKEIEKFEHKLENK